MGSGHLWFRAQFDVRSFTSENIEPQTEPQPEPQ